MGSRQIVFEKHATERIREYAVGGTAAETGSRKKENVSKWRKWAAALCAAVCMSGAVCTSAAAGVLPGSGLYMIDNNGFPVSAGELEMQILWSGGRGVELDAVIDHDGTAIGEQENVATGQTITASDQGFEIWKQTAVVMGDVAGTGEAGLPQLIRMAKALNGSEPLEGIYAKAADLSGDGKFGVEDIVLAAAQYAALSDPENREISSSVVPIHYAGHRERRMLLYFMDGETQIPWISLDMAKYYWNKNIARPWGIEVADEAIGEMTTWTRENGSVAILDCADNTISFSDYDAFMMPAGSKAVLDVLQAPQVLDDTGEYIRRAPGSFGRCGRPVTADLGAYGIELIWQNDRAYIPLQTFEDVFMSALSVQWLYNGEAVYQVDDGDLPDHGDGYYDVAPEERSEALCVYSYNELCMFLDMFYGLKEQHDITTFDALFDQTGLNEALLSADGATGCRAINELCLGYLADLHSSFIAPSHYAGKDADVSTDNISASVVNSNREMARLEQVRDAAYPDGVPGYEEVGNTAYVTFDEFTWRGTADYYADAPEEIPNDTVGLIMYAHRQITREDSPIENVVIDLTNNYGGSTDAAIYVIGWFLGGEADMSLNSALTGAQATTKYQVDVNADGHFDESDSVQHLNRYCLISQNSFSCGNLVPAAFKASNQVTLLGRNTGGGACVVQTCSAADGTLFRVSGPLRISTLSNGAFYDVDRGIVPDVPITKFETYYNRAALNELIEGLSR